MNETDMQKVRFWRLHRVKKTGSGKIASGIEMLKADASVKDSLAGKRQRCAWSFSYALTVVNNWAFS